MEKQIIELLEDLHDPYPCEFDHHGNCQAHGWFGDRPCPQKRLKTILTREQRSARLTKQEANAKYCDLMKLSKSHLAMLVMGWPIEN